MTIFGSLMSHDMQIYSPTMVNCPAPLRSVFALSSSALLCSAPFLLCPAGLCSTLLCSEQFSIAAAVPNGAFSSIHETSYGRTISLFWGGVGGGLWFFPSN